MAIEEPAYQVVLRDGAFEVRDYPALVAAEVTVGGDRDAAANAGFRLLAGYIFGGNTRRQSIAMTAPVVQARAGQSIPMTAPVTQSRGAGGWTIRFMMPRGFTLETLPVPNDKRVRLLALPPVRAAVIRFSGLTPPAEVDRRTKELEAFITARRLRPVGAPSLARYDPPWTLWFARRNEVMIPIAR